MDTVNNEYQDSTKRETMELLTMDFDVMMLLLLTMMSRNDRVNVKRSLVKVDDVNRHWLTKKHVVNCLLQQPEGPFQ